MTTFTIHTNDVEQSKALKAVLKALKIKFEVDKKEKLYDPAFVTKIKRSQKQLKEGKSTIITTDQLDDFLGI
jgi:trehalose-6-phosphate synthase